MDGRKYRFNLFGMHYFRTIKQKVDLLLEYYFWFCTYFVAFD